ncbi:Uma2 family endonuclease [Streptomyces salinarius]|uniref:Uma2 family endonuclease n=1 Tax=Streptomyces salinarius TaxID=2762598 RepID=UPI0028F70DBF|nr:Uma2 family endonuclease [Streptomyces salinarius]
MREEARLEFIGGRFGRKVWPDGPRGCVVQWLTRSCLSQRPELWLDSRQGLGVGRHREGRARPDGSLVPSHAFAGAGEWADPAPVLMVVEVTSYDSDTDRRDRVDKPRAYAETGIPVYLLVDRDTCEVKVHSRPDGGRYETVQTLPFGKEVVLPDPVGISLDTEPLKNWVR